MATPTNLPAAFVANTILTATQQNDLRGAFRTLQLVSGTYSTQTSSTSATYATTGLSAIITPQAATNTVLVIISLPLSNGAAGDQVGVRLIKTIGATTTTEASWTYALYTSSGTGQNQFCVPFVSSPATTSAVTYTVHFARTSGTGTAYVQTGNTTSVITLQEISA